MLKKIFFLFFFTILIGCGYTPVHNIEKNKKISISSLEFINGDREINIGLKQNLRPFISSNESNNSFSLITESLYTKDVISKNSAGIVTKYSLKAEVTFVVKYKNKSENLRFSETFVMDKLDDDFENRKYENTIKQNFANTIYQKLVTKLLSIQ